MDKHAVHREDLGGLKLYKKEKYFLIKIFILYLEKSRRKIIFAQLKIFFNAILYCLLCKYFKILSYMWVFDKNTKYNIFLVFYIYLKNPSNTKQCFKITHFPSFIIIFSHKKYSKFKFYVNGFTNLPIALSSKIFVKSHDMEWCCISDHIIPLITKRKHILTILV